MTATAFLRALRPLAVFTLAATSLAHAQGSLTPPASGPAPSMKSLQEIWDELSAVKAENQALSAKLNQLQTSLAAQSLQTQLALATLTPLSALSWIIADLSPSGSFTSLAFTPDGQPAVAFKSGKQLRFARYDGATWSAAIVDTEITPFESFQPAGFLSLAFGPDGRPAIAYQNVDLGDLRFARFDGANWSVTTVDANGFTGTYASLAFGPDGHPAISYYDFSNGNLRFARFTGSTWAITTVDSNGDTGQFTSLAFGPDGQPAIAYHDATNRYLRFARFDGANWNLTTADVGGFFVGQITTGQFTSLAFGPDGQPAISYVNVSSYDLMFTRYDGSTWTRTAVDSDAFVNHATSLAFGPDGRPVISYYANGLRFARFNGTTWALTTIDSTAGYSNSLAFGLDGQPAIAYHSTNSGGLVRFARLGLFKPAP